MAKICILSEGLYFFNFFSLKDPRPTGTRPSSMAQVLEGDCWNKSKFMHIDHKSWADQSLENSLLKLKALVFEKLSH